MKFVNAVSGGTMDGNTTVNATPPHDWGNIADSLLYFGFVVLIVMFVVWALRKLG